MDFEVLKNVLREHGQEHLLAFWDELDDSGKEKLKRQLESLDWDAVDEWIREYVYNTPVTPIPHDLRPAPVYTLEPPDTETEKQYEQAREKGREELRKGTVAGFTVAGGQGTRLGFDGPKGAFPISPVKGKSLFQLFAEQIQRAEEKYDTAIPWYIMTSEANHEATKELFEENDYFGYNPERIMFFKQGMLPAIGTDGKLLLEAPDSLALSPNGHGGSIQALQDSGALRDMAAKGIQHISYWQVDNPLVNPFDPLFIGLHAQQEAEVSCRALPKTGPFEKLGNFCLTDDTVKIIEYSDMPRDLAEAKDKNGQLRFRMGSPAIHIFSRDFAEKLNKYSSFSLPLHKAVKKVPHIDGEGNPVSPEEPNAVKLEMFIFDTLPLAERVVLLEADRKEEFAPVKNATGTDSIESSRELFQERCARWLENAGITVPRRENGTLNCTLELSARSFMDQKDVQEKADQLHKLRPEQKEYYE